MNWRDLLYFSKGERRALTLLLCLITASWIILLVTEDPASPTPEYSPTLSPPDSSGRKNISSRKKTEFHPKGTSVSSEGNKSTFKGKNSTLKGNSRYPIGKKGTPYKAYPTVEKYPEGTLIELNTADTASLKKVPGIGSTFARRIVKYRKLLGGFYTVEQLQEVYGIDETRYQSLKKWFTVDTVYMQQLPVNRLPADSLNRHPYISYRQARAIEQLRKQKSRLSGWENLQLIEEFNDGDKERLRPYLSFR
ncbi:helix-hairpin-helix domain-containing protein [Parabacteroides sp. AM08-6]|uniref:helix-hairpin-helix domain-containing protein n=1 Tax=Parabacteroides sp. AM08-6 TaxID=2292053 RepID=UPI000EFF9E9B|nr:helix-hairpin-helix domain-containing protein [Parabacteroides sp. AM08-6]RHJ84883.1 helix-hairpin-helix domain-containing protein [Parabacteroides sp. AM08-6]